MTKPTSRSSQHQAIEEALFRALKRYDRELQSMRDLRMALGGQGPTIKRGTKRSALAHYLAGVALSALEDEDWE